MDRVAQFSPRDRSDLFRAAADAKGVSVQIIEKDFWVCWVLRHLYTLDGMSAPLFFKGGTSLSKAFGIIDRMSEDIDLVIDREALGFTGDRDPMREDLSRKARARLIKELKAEAARFVADTLHPLLDSRFAQILGSGEGWSTSADVSNVDNTIIEFAYPTVEDKSRYLKDRVILELGARGDTWPAVKRTIRPYAADSFPDVFDTPESAVRAITAGRTFWEKATLLHTLAHRDADKVAAARPARHYYDLYLLANHELGKAAIRDTQLLADVVRHKTTFYARASDPYDLAVPGTFRLVPGADTISALQPEYRQMAEEMVFGDAPSLEAVMDRLREIEARINGSSD